MKGKRLYKSRYNKFISGVCGGLAEYLDFDPTIVRLVVVALSFFSCFTGVVIYIIAAIIMPYKDEIDDDIIDIN